MKVLVWVMTTALMAASGSALAQGPGGGGMRGPGMHGGPFGPGPMGAWWKEADVAKRVGLTEDQSAKVEAAFKAHRDKLIDLRAALEKREGALQDLMDADPVDASKVRAAADQLEAAKGALGREFLEMMLQVRAVVTRDQWRQLHALHRERMEHGRGHMDAGPGAGAPPGPAPDGGKPPMGP